jgi:hypothetical protein
MDAMDGLEVVIVEAECVTVVETRGRLAVPFDAVSRFCTAKVLHRSQVSEGEIQWGTDTCCRHHVLTP